MSYVYWWLMAVSFILGVIFTWWYMVRRADH